MSIGPDRLNGITAHESQSSELKCRRRQRLFRPLVQVPHDIRLAFAARARTSSPELFHRNEAFSPVLPFDGQFLANGLYVRGAHAYTGVLSTAIISIRERESSK